MRKFYKVRNCQTGSSELVLADGHVDALSFYHKKNNVEKSVTLECSDYFAHILCDEKYFITKLSELPDGSIFYKVISRTSECAVTPYIKCTAKANGMVQCHTLYDENTPYSYFKGSIKVAILPKEVQECLRYEAVQLTR